MPQGNNAVAPYTGSPTWDQEVAAQEALKSLGVTQFVGADGWYQTIGGIIFQGGYVTAVPLDSTVVVPFKAGFTQQVLGVFVTAVFAGPSGVANDASAGVVTGSVTLAQFELINDGALKDFYWFAFGV